MAGAGWIRRRTGLRTVVAAAVAVPVLATVRASSRAGALGETPGRAGPVPPLEVMTFNLRFASAKEPHSWAARRPVTRALLRAAAPHVIGSQEGRSSQVRDIEADLGPHYDRIGTGRGGGDDESMTVFYDTRRLTPVEHAHFWLSDTPGVPGSNTWGAAHPRMVTWVRFRDLRAGGREFCVFNTHLDNRSRYARLRSVSLIARRLARFDRALPMLVTGDFNAVAHRDAVHAGLLNAGLVDTWDAARRRGAAYGTYHGYREPRPGGDRIDWILASPFVTVHRARVDTFSVNGQYPSDHLPVQVSLSL
ncbi:endonuclease/exonuclease/phosphatase family protein [Streptomyces sp. NPDC052015]|uniref:endonuclease/exonuclease/phosphatase family protein n=1 Tax=Streptomyces sp. NPDC052015 TaxID=3154755 RepID=UPI00341675CA